MNTFYTIQNFRVFNQEGQTFKMSPITVLTGCNSSGKSSLVKSQLLLRDFMRKIHEGLDKGNCRPDLYHLQLMGNETKLGAFNSVKNHDSEDGSKISFSYEVSVPEIDKPILVEYEFIEDKNDFFHNGILSRIRVSGRNGKIIYEAERTDDLSDTRPEIGMRLETKTLDLNYFLPLQISGKRGKNESKINRTDLFNLEIYNRLKDATKENIHSFLPIFEHEEKTEELLENIIKRFEESEFATFGGYVDHLSEDVLSVVEPLDASIETGTDIYGFEKILRRYISENSNWDVYHDLSRLASDSLRHEFASGNMSKEDVICAIIKENSKNLHLKNQFIFSALSQLSLRLCGAVAAGSQVQPNRDPLVLEQNNTFNTFCNECIDIILKAMSPSFIRNIEYVSSSRATMARVYILDDRRDEFSRILTNYAEEVSRYKSNASENSTFSPGSFINKWAKRFEIGESVEFKYGDNGQGLSIVVHKDKTDTEGHLLADEGYGLTQLLSILLSIEILAMRAKPLEKANKRYMDDEKRLSDPTVGFYDFPLYFGNFEPSTLAVEEPEIHLHPEYQSKLAEMFLDAYRRFSIEFIIETHSEYLIRRLQTMIPQVKRGHEYGLDLDELSIYYINSPKRVKEDPLLKQVVRVKVGEDGRLQNSFGPGFFDEATKQALKLVYPEM